MTIPNTTLIKCGLAAILVLGATIYVTNLRSTVTSQRASIERLESDNQTLTQNNASLKASIDKTNAAIEKLAAGTAESQAAFNALSITVTKKLGSLNTQLNGVLAETKPQTCDGTIEYLIKAASEYPK